MAIEDHWPFFALRVRTPRLEVRVPDDEIGVQLGELAVRGVHDPASTPFAIPWTDAPADELPRNSLQHYWLCRAQLRPEAWHLSLAALVDGEVVGAGGIAAEEFARRRTFETGSWMGQAFQGRGLGFEFRQACLHLGFAGLGAEVATTGAWHDNAASLGVTAKLPYVPNGEDGAAPAGAGRPHAQVPDAPRRLGDGAPRRHRDRRPRPLPPHPRPLTHRIGGSRSRLATICCPGSGGFSWGRRRAWC